VSSTLSAVPRDASTSTRRWRVDDRYAVLPAWPLDVVLWGFPIWWLLGVVPFVFVAAGLVMATLLTAYGWSHVRLPPGVAPYLFFVAWLVPCALALDNPDRVIGFDQRAADEVAVAVALVYVVNASQRISVERVLGGLTAVWGFVVIGGYLGVLFPNVRVTTPVGRILPSALTSNELVRDLVFPPFAEVQEPFGAPAPFNRPSAPFPYANQWGSAVALLTPIAIALLCRTSSWRLRTLIVLGFVALGVPALYSSNRGMFLALALVGVYVAGRLFLRGRIIAVLSLMVVGAIAVVGFVSAGLGSSVEERQRYSDTTGGRTRLYEETFEASLRSPIVGYGAPRPSAETTISLGTQGYVWQLMFSFGFVGLALFAYFLVNAVWRTRAASSTSELWMHGALTVTCVTIVYYGLDTVQKLSLVVLVGVLLRSAADDRQTL